MLNPALAWAASMMRDIGNGAPRIEVDIVGDLLHRADGFGIDAPLFRAAWVHLQVYALQRASATAGRVRLSTGGPSGRARRAAGSVGWIGAVDTNDG